jgi:hypothetical protein
MINWKKKKQKTNKPLCHSSLGHGLGSQFQVSDLPNAEPKAEQNTENFLGSHDDF